MNYKIYTGFYVDSFLITQIYYKLISGSYDFKFNCFKYNYRNITL